MPLRIVQALSERNLGPEVYWSVDLYAIATILEDGYITPSPALGADVGEYANFISLSRVPINSYRNVYSGATVVFDGRAIQARYKVDPINYWNQPSDFNWREKANEAEERVYTNDDKVPIKGIIKEIHCMFKEEDNERGTLFQFHNAKKYGCTVYFYSNQSDFKHLRRDKAKTMKDVEDDLKYVSRSKTADDRDLKNLEALIADIKGGMRDPNGIITKHSDRDRGPQADCIIHAARRKKGMAARLLFRELEKVFQEHGTRDIVELVKQYPPRWA